MVYVLSIPLEGRLSQNSDSGPGFFFLCHVENYFFTIFNVSYHKN